MTNISQDKSVYTNLETKVGSPRNMALVLLAALGMYVMQLTMANALSLRVATIDPNSKAASYSLAVSVSSFLLLITIPLGGALSDRTTSRMGRRRPWIIGGLGVALLGSAMIGLVDSIPAIVAIYVVTTIGMNAGFNAYAVIPVEGIPDHQRARVMGMMGMFGALSVSLGSYMAAYLVHHQLLMMTAPVLLAICTSIPLLLIYRDPVVASDSVPELQLRQLFKSFLVNPRRHPNFGWTWLSRFLAGVAMTAFFSYFIYFLMDNLGMDIGKAGAKAGFLTLVSAPVSIVFFSLSGYLSDRVGRRKPFVVASALIMGTALVMGGLSNSFTMFMLAWLLFAMGQAMYLTVDLALCAAVLPDARDTGKDMAVFSLALSIPNIVVPAAAPALLGLGASGHNYTLLWCVAGGLCAAGSIAIRQVRGVA